MNPDRTFWGALTRRRALQLAGATALAGFAPAVPARAASRPIKVGYVTPTTGPLAPLAEADDYILKARAGSAEETASSIPGEAYPIEILVKDSQSNPNRAAEVAGELILQDGDRLHGRRRDARELQSGLRPVRAQRRAVHLDHDAVAALVLRARRRSGQGLSTGPTTISGGSRTLSRSSPASGSRSTPTRVVGCSSPTTATATPGAMQNWACRRR